MTHLDGPRTDSSPYDDAFPDADEEPEKKTFVDEDEEETQDI